MNKKTRYLIIGIIVIVLVIAGIFMFRPKTTDGDYSSSDYGLSFKYPQNSYVIQERTTGSGDTSRHTITLIPKVAKESLLNGKSSMETPTSITIDIYPVGNSSLEEWLGESKDSHFDSLNGTLATTSVDKKFAVAYSWNGFYRTNSVVFEHNGNIFMTSMTYNSVNDQIWEDFPVILRSIKLL